MNMSAETSELQLKSLDKSKDDPNILLQQAAVIAGIKYEDLVEAYGTPVDIPKEAPCREQRNPSGGFREQWLLKWILRKLNETTQTVASMDEKGKPGQPARLFVLNVNTWSLTLHLLSVIDRQRAVDILLERNYTRILGIAGTLMLEERSSSLIQSSDPAQDAQEPDRPRKRLRLSSDLEDSSNQTPQSDSGFIGTRDMLFARVLEAWGKLLQPQKQESLASHRSVTPAWADSAKEAAHFVGSALRHTWAMKTGFNTSRTRVLGASVVTLWLQLLHTFSKSNNVHEKDAFSKLFNDTCLKSCMRLSTLFMGINEAKVITARKELESKIALFTLLPLRSTFNKRYMSAWKGDHDVLSWQIIEPLINLFQDQLGEALRPEANAGSNIVSFPESWMPSCLLSISSRLLPKEDVRRRQQETPWLQALTLCLAHLAYPSVMPKMQKITDGLLQPVEDITLLNIHNFSGHSRQWPSDLLNTITAEEMKFSTPVKEYLAASILAWRNRPLPAILLSKVVKLDPNLFVPSIGGPNSQILLDNLLTTISERKLLSGWEYRIIIKSVIRPLMEAFVRARDLEGLVKLLLPNLEEALRVRTTAQFERRQIPTILVWDDKDLYTNFAALCRLHAPRGFGLNLLNETINQMRTMPERIGSTIDVFANLALVESIVQSKGNDVLNFEDYLQGYKDLAELVVHICQQQNGYQGQRWRLWSMLTTLRQIDPQFDRFDLVRDSVANACTFFHSTQILALDKLQQSQRSALLMEQYAIFTFLIEHCNPNDQLDDTEETTARTLLIKEHGNLAKLVRQVSEANDIGSITQKTKDRGSFAQDPFTGNLVSEANDNQSLSQNEIEDGLKSEATGHDSGLKEYDDNERNSEIQISEHQAWDGQVNNMRSTKQLVEGLLACLIQNHTKLNRMNVKSIDLSSALRPALGYNENSLSQGMPKVDLNELATKYLAKYISTESEDINSLHSAKEEMERLENGNLINPIQIQSQYDIDASAVRAQTRSKGSATDPLEAQKILLLQQQQPSDLETAMSAGSMVVEINDSDLKAHPDIAGILATGASIEHSTSAETVSKLIMQFEYCMLVLKLQPGIVNQATVDNLLKDLAILTSATMKIDSKFRDVRHTEAAIFDRLIAFVGILLTKYRRRLTGRTHLLLPVLQNLLKCFFYTPSRTYMYQNPGTSKQKQAFRSSLPGWLSEEALPVSSAVKFSKIVSSICNPSTASARSAHRRKQTNGSKDLGLNDETKKARRIASQYMQYLVMEYARCTLDGVIQPEVREKLMPGIYSVLDAMDRDLIKAMNSAMDPSSRAIFKGLYDDWMKHWKWDQS